MLLNTFVIISFFLYKIFNIYSNKINAAISASIVGSTIHIFVNRNANVCGTITCHLFHWFNILSIRQLFFYKYVPIYATFVFLCFMTRSFNLHYNNSSIISLHIYNVFNKKVKTHCYYCFCIAVLCILSFF